MENSRKVIQNILLGLGVERVLTEMPAIIERINKDMANTTPDYIMSKIHVLNDGKTIAVDNNFSYTKQDDGTVEIRNFDDMDSTKLGVNTAYDHVIKVNKYGIDESDIDSDMFLSSSISRTDDGRLRIIGVKGEERYEPDPGDAILNYNNYTILRENSNSSLGWEGNKQFLTTNYPMTKTWFRIKEEQIKAREENREPNEIKEENELPVKTPEEYEEIIRMQLLRTKELEKDNSNLKEQNRSLIMKMKTLLDFAEKVRDSRVGRIFFRKHIKELPSASKQDDLEK